MAASGKGSGGGSQRGSSGRGGARSLGAAAGSSHPNGAILYDEKEITDLQKGSPFRNWAHEQRQKKLKANRTLMDYGSM